jgi:hypothetical protein
VSRRTRRALTAGGALVLAGVAAYVGLVIAFVLSVDP